MIRRLAPALGLIVVLTPAMALAQVNIDQNKSPAQLYAGDCAACHKSMRGLANGRSASALAGFLTEHYTASSREAAAIAAYVVASGGAGSAARVQPEGKPPGNSAAGAHKPEPERRAAAEPGQPGAARGGQPARHERGATRTRGRVKPVEAVAPPPPPPAPEAKTAVVAAPPPAESAAAAPAPVPAPQASSGRTAEPNAAAPAESGEASPVPRDNIPD